MSWASKLLETYDICQSEVGKERETGMLLPLSHLTTKAQIEVVLDENGKIDYHLLKPVLFELPTDEYLRTGEVIGKCKTIGTK